MSTDPPPIPPELREGAPLPEPTTVWTPRAERAKARGMGGGGSGSLDGLMKMGGVSLNFAYSVAGLAALGWLVDYLAKTFPIGLLSGAGLGVIVGGWRFVREATAMNRKQARAMERRPRE